MEEGKLGNPLHGGLVGSSDAGGVRILEIRSAEVTEDANKFADEPGPAHDKFVPLQGQTHQPDPLSSTHFGSVSPISLPPEGSFIAGSSITL